MQSVCKETDYKLDFVLGQHYLLICFTWQNIAVVGFNCLRVFRVVNIYNEYA